MSPAPALELSDLDRRMADGREGEAAALAMRFILRAAEATGAEHLIDITGAHLIGGFYMGEVGLDLVRRLVELEARVRVPTTLTAASIDLTTAAGDRSTPQLAGQLDLAELYPRMGAEPVWTCAPYHLPGRPGPGEQVAWGESGAVAFANSLLGARTNLYGEPLDVAAAITGRVPAAGLHLTENRAGRVVFDLRELDPGLFADDAAFQVLGYLVGAQTGSAIAVLDGLPDTASEDQVAALVSAGASSGGVEMLHVIGTTPEAPTLETALQGREPERVVTLRPPELRDAAAALSTARRDEPLTTVCVGAPHLSLTELERIVTLLDRRRVASGITFYASTCRFIADEARRRGHLEALERAGVTLVLDRCTYYGDLVRGDGGAVMTSSAKWAHYGPALLGTRVMFADLRECVESAVAGRAWIDEAFWSDARWT